MISEDLGCQVKSLKSYFLNLASDALPTVATMCGMISDDYRAIPKLLVMHQSFPGDSCYNYVKIRAIF